MARYDNNNSNPYSWMPGFLRRFLNLDYDEAKGSEPSQSASQASASYSSPSVAATRATWASPGEPTFKASNGEPTFKASNMEGYRAPSGTAPATPATPYTPPQAPAPNPPTRDVSMGPIAATFAQLDGSVQPVTHLLRGFLRGALPPQGLEAFTKEARTTTTNVWNLYSHWFRFETEEVFQFGRAVLTAVSDSITSAVPSPASAPARRIKVTVANGNGNGNGHAEPAANAASSDG